MDSVDTLGTATVYLFKPSGKLYTEESWRIPDVFPSFHPGCMIDSPDFRRIDGGAVLVPADSYFEGDTNWGFPVLFNATNTEDN